MLIAFEELRPGIESTLRAADFRTTDYVAEALTPPCACVIPGNPYLVWRTGNERVPFNHFVAFVDVLLVSHRESNKKAASLIEGQILKAVSALGDDYNIRQVSQPRVTSLGGAKFLASVLSIEETVKEPV